MTLIAKPVIDKQFWILQDGNQKVGNNILANRLHILKNKITLTDLNKPISTFKVMQKKLLLSNVN